MSAHLFVHFASRDCFASHTYNCDTTRTHTHAEEDFGEYAIERCIQTRVHDLTHSDYSLRPMLRRKGSAI